MRRVARPKPPAGPEAELWPTPDALRSQHGIVGSPGRKTKAPENNGLLIQDEQSTGARWPHLRQVSQKGAKALAPKEEKQHDGES